MAKEGKYIYCIIETNSSCNFGPMGIGGQGDEVVNICCEGLSAVVSNTPMTKYTLSRENLLTHEKVIEEVMKEFTVLPTRFCSIAESADEIRNLLGKRNREFKGLLRDMDGKVELGLKAFWKDMKQIYKEIANSPEIKTRRSRVGKALSLTLDKQIESGKLVESLLAKKKAEEAENILSHLRRSAYDVAFGKLNHERMFLNAAFLVDKSRETEFDNLVDELDEKYSAKGPPQAGKGGSASGGKDRAQLKYVGPVPPYNFINIVIKGA